MDAQINIGKSILDQYSEHAKTELLDDEAEFFPTIKVIIQGIVRTLDPSEDIAKLESELIDHVKQHYVALWLEQATEDEEDPDIDYETKRATDDFDRFYFNK